MVPISSTGPAVLPTESRQRLSGLAYRSIEHGLEHQAPLHVDPTEFTQELREVRSSFVTLEINHRLRGCIGSLVPRYPLVQDVVEHAYGAAFRDPRFSPVTRGELALLQIHISVLSAAAPLEFQNEQDLLSQLEPGVDGLILRRGRNEATFLPAVWEKIPDPGEFLSQLKLKAGLDRNYWSDAISIERYSTESW